MIKTLVATAFVLSSASQAWAQHSDATAMEIAQANGACSNTAITSARFLEDGRVGVRCASGTVTNRVVSSQGIITAATPTVPVRAVIGGVAGIIGIAAANSGSSSTSDTQ